MSLTSVLSIGLDEIEMDRTAVDSDPAFGHEETVFEDVSVGEYSSYFGDGGDTAFYQPFSAAGPTFELPSMPAVLPPSVAQSTPQPSMHQLPPQQQPVIEAPRVVFVSAPAPAPVAARAISPPMPAPTSQQAPAAVLPIPSRAASSSASPAPAPADGMIEEEGTMRASSSEPFMPAAPHPVARFGFGGQLVTCFPREGGAGTVQIRSVQGLLAAQPFAQALEEFPGPLIRTKGQPDAPGALDLASFLKKSTTTTVDADANTAATSLLWEVLRSFYHHQGVVQRRGARRTQENGKLPEPCEGTLEHAVLGLLAERRAAERASKQAATPAPSSSNDAAMTAKVNGAPKGKAAADEVDSILEELDGLFVDDDDDDDDTQLQGGHVATKPVDSKEVSH